MNALVGGEVQGKVSAVAGRGADPAPSIQVEPSARRYATQSSPASIGTPGTRSGMNRWKGQPRRCSPEDNARFQRSQIHPPSTGVECRHVRQFLSAGRSPWQWSWCSHRRHCHHAGSSEIFAGGRGASITRFALAIEPLPRRRIGAHPLDMDLVGVLADGDVHGAGDAGQVHVDLHLRPMLRLGALDAVLFQRREGFRRVGLELDHVPGFRRFEQADGDGVERAAEVAAQRRDLPLPAGLRDRCRERWRRCGGDRGRGGPPPACRSRTAAASGPRTRGGSPSGSRTRGRARTPCR